MSEKKTRKGHRSERVKRLIDDFHHDFMNGLSIAEIEEKHDVSKGYAYGLLDEIAAKNGVSKETYYQMEHGPHICISRDGRLLPNKNISFEEIKGNLADASKSLTDASRHLEELTQLIEDEIEQDI